VADTVDISGLTQQIESQQKILDESSASIEKYKQKLQELANQGITSAKDALQRLGDKFKNVDKIIEEEANKALDKLKSNLSDITVQSPQAANAIGVLTVAAFGASKAFDGFGDVRGVSTFNNQLTSLKSSISGITTIADPMIGALTKMFGIDLGKVAGQFGLDKAKEIMGGLVDRFAAGADSAIKLQMGFLQAAAAGGSFGQVIEAAGPHLRNLDSMLETQTELLQGVSKTTGMSAEDVVNYYNQWARIPGNLRTVGDATQNVIDQTHAFSDVSKLAAGTGQTLDQVMQQLSVAQANYGLSGQQANEYIARTAELSQELGVGMSDAVSYMEDVSSQFKFLGDNADGAAENFAKLFQGLRDGGVSMKTAAELAGDLQGQLAHLSTAQEALISSRTGGPGGLMGAAQIEQMLKTGKSGEVFDKVRQLMTQQMGGQITTLQQATQSQASAAQFTRERQMITSGVFGIGKGMSEAQATDIITALAKPGGKLQEKDAASLLAKTTEKGADIQSRSLTALNQIVANTEWGKMMGGIATARTARGMLGGAGDVQNPAATDLMNRMRSEGRQAERGATGRIFASEAERSPGNWQALLQSLGQDIPQLLGVAKGMPDTFKQLFTSEPMMPQRGTMPRQMPPGTIRDQVQASLARPNPGGPAPAGHHTAPPQQPRKMQLTGTLVIKGNQGTLQDAQVHAIAPIPSNEPGY
jgi:hypothetical protein